MMLITRFVTVCFSVACAVVALTSISDALPTITAVGIPTSLTMPTITAVGIPTSLTMPTITAVGIPTSLTMPTITAVGNNVPSSAR